MTTMTYREAVRDKVPVGTVLATVRDDQTPATTSPTIGGQPTPPVPSATALPPPATRSPLARPPIEASRLRISPSTRQLARERGVDPAIIPGTGRGGAITREDLERVVAARSTAAPVPSPPVPLPSGERGKGDGRDRLSRMRQTIAAAMSRSKREIPHYYLATTIDLHRALTWLAEANLQRPVTERLLAGILFLKAVALALHEVPELNALWTDDHAVLSQAIHVGVAIALRQGGLVAPALHDTDQQSLDQLMRNFRDLVNRARAGSLRSSELSDPTITVTSLGGQGVDTLFGIIYPPQVAIVGFGKVVERPWVVDGQVVARPVVQATLSADHRVSDGHRGALFLAAVDRLLQEPSKL